MYWKEHTLELVNIFTDQQTGKNFDRPRYMVLVEDVLREGDILLVTELDRLGRNKRDTMEQIRKLQSMDVRLMVLELPTTLMDLTKMDNSMARLMMETINNMMLELYASMAEAELEKRLSMTVYYTGVVLFRPDLFMNGMLRKIRYHFSGKRVLYCTWPDSITGLRKKRDLSSLQHRPMHR